MEKLEELRQIYLEFYTDLSKIKCLLGSMSQMSEEFRDMAMSVEVVEDYIDKIQKGNERIGELFDF